MLLGKRTKDSGFSLMELMVALGLAGIVSLGAMKLFEGMNRNKLLGTINSKRQEEILELQREIQKIKTNVFTNNFYPLESYAYSSQLKKALWANNAKKFKDFSFNAYNTSHSLEIVNSSTRSSFVFSRCVPKADFDKNYSPATAYALMRVPLVKFSGNNIEVYCCLKTVTSFCGSKISNAGSPYRVKTFYYNNGTFKSFPLEGDKRFIKGTGFFLYFNKASNPSLFNVIVFSQSEHCTSFDKNCQSSFITKYQTIGGTVSANGVQDTGLLQVN